MFTWLDFALRWLLFDGLKDRYVNFYRLPKLLSVWVLLSGPVHTIFMMWQLAIQCTYANSMLLSTVYMLFLHLHNEECSVYMEI